MPKAQPRTRFPAPTPPQNTGASSTDEGAAAQRPRAPAGTHTACQPRLPRAPQVSSGRHSWPGPSLSTWGCRSLTLLSLSFLVCKMGVIRRQGEAPTGRLVPGEGSVKCCRLVLLAALKGSEPQAKGFRLRVSSLGLLGRGAGSAPRLFSALTGSPPGKKYSWAVLMVLWLEATRMISSQCEQELRNFLTISSTKTIWAALLVNSSLSQEPYQARVGTHWEKPLQREPKH